jgi:hypothetical protein
MNNPKTLQEIISKFRELFLNRNLHDYHDLPGHIADPGEIEAIISQAYAEGARAEREKPPGLYRRNGESVHLVCRSGCGCLPGKRLHDGECCWVAAESDIKAPAEGEE